MARGRDKRDDDFRDPDALKFALAYLRQMDYARAKVLTFMPVGEDEIHVLYDNMKSDVIDSSMRYRAIVDRFKMMAKLDMVTLEGQGGYIDLGKPMPQELGERVMEDVKDSDISEEEAANLISKAKVRGLNAPGCKYRIKITPNDLGEIVKIFSVTYTLSDLSF